MPQTIENSAAPDSSPFNEHQGNIPPAAVNTSQQLVAPTIAPQQAPPDPAPILQINNSLSQQQQPQQQPTQRTVLLQNDFNFKTSSTFTNTSNSSSNSSSSNSKLGNRQNKNEITIESSGKSTELKDAELSGENSSELMSVESEEDYSNEIINPETVQKFNRVSKRIDTLCRDHIVGNDPTVRYQKRRLCKKRNASGRKCVFKGLQDHCCPFMGTNIACLHGGARWTGMQSTKGKVHAVEVVFQDVKLDQDYLCGYLTIKGLTLDYPILTTYFEADIIGNAHRFLTQKWQANFDTDLKHWSKFKEFEALKDQFCNGEDYHQDHAESDFLFMRWKEKFLVPCHQVNSIPGASFAGFYYICLNRHKPSIYGFYYHQTSEWYQCLELEFVNTKTSGIYQFA